MFIVKDILKKLRETSSSKENNGIINKRVDPDRYDDYLDNGWKPGMKKR